jgi:hypothetical protein
LPDPISEGKKKKKLHKKEIFGGVVQVVGPEFKPPYHKKKKKICNVCVLTR